MNVHPAHPFCFMLLAPHQLRGHVHLSCTPIDYCCLSSNWHPYMAFSFQCSSHLGGSNSASYTALSSIWLVYSSLWILALNAMPAIVHPLGADLCSCVLFMGFRTAIFMPSLIDSKRCAVRLNLDLQKQVPFAPPGVTGHPPCCNACLSLAYLA